MSSLAAMQLTSLRNGSKEAQILQPRAFVHQDKLYAAICQVAKWGQAQCTLITSTRRHNGHDALELPLCMLPATLQSAVQLYNVVMQAFGIHQENGHEAAQSNHLKPYYTLPWVRKVLHE